MLRERAAVDFQEDVVQSWSALIPEQLAYDILQSYIVSSEPLSAYSFLTTSLTSSAFRASRTEH
jgi:hypothetical protein